MAFCRQLKLLLWKNYKLLTRQKIRVCVELVWPLVLFLILTWVKIDRGIQEHMHECHYDGKGMPSSGMLPFFQGLLCTSGNTCHKTMTPDEVAGRVQNFNNSLLSEIFLEVENVLGNRTEMGSLVNLLDDVNALRSLSQKLQDGTAECDIQIRKLLKNPDNVEEKIASQNISLTRDDLETLFNSSLNITELQRLLAARYNSSYPDADNIPDVTWLSLSDLSSQNSTVIAQVVRNATCGEDGGANMHEKLLEFSVNAHRQEEVLNALCNLTDDQLTLLVEDLRQEVDMWALWEEIAICAEKAGSKLAFDRETATMYQTIMQDLQNMESLVSIIDDLNRTRREFGDLDLSHLNNTENSTKLLGWLFCGREDGVLRPVEETGKTWESRANAGDTDYDETHLYVYDNTTTEFCNDIFKSFQATRGMRILWRQIKPMMRGKLPYSPDTPAVRKIIHQANSSFEAYATLRQMTMDWHDTASPGLRDYFQNDVGLKILKNLTTQIHTSNENDEYMPRVDELLSWLGDKQSEEDYNWESSLDQMDAVMATLKKYLDCFQFDKFEAHQNEEELIEKSLSYIEDNMLWGAIIFDGMDYTHTDKLLPNTTVRIRLSVDRVDTTSKGKVVDKYWTAGPRAKPLPDMKYIVYGFVYIQDMIEHGILQLYNPAREKIGMFLQQFPYPCYLSDKFTQQVSKSVPLFMTLAWLFSVAMIVKGIVYEKEQRLKEVMKVMGLGNGVHWVAWFITSFIVMITSVLLLVTLLKVGTLMQHSDASVLLVFMLIFTIVTILQCFMISVFFSRANLAAACAGVFYFVGYLPYSFCVRWEDHMTSGQKSFASLSSTVAFGFGSTYILKYEQQGVGIQWNNMAHSPVVGDDFSLLGSMVMMLIDAVIYGLITWYIEAVFPGQFGVPRPWYFFVTKSYWMGSSYVSDSEMGRRNYEMNPNQQTSENFEAEPTAATMGVSIKGLRKVYKHSKKVAVDGLDLNFYEGQITSFLGHNGAGKTTTMSILTGLFPPTEGTAQIYGYDIRSDMDSIRTSMGMCPQHNVLFDRLTVEEHVWFYASLKGMQKERIQEEIDQLILDVGLPHKRHDQSKKLSGGMKRKLSVAIAFVADSRVVILDEPTAGVDPYARRSIWELLLKYRQGRTIILSTHFMDEADVLGDRIAIISQGKLCCCGSSLFLKGRFGSGYNLTLVKGTPEVEDKASESGRDSAQGSSVRLADSKLSLPTAGLPVMPNGRDEGIADMETGSDSASSTAGTSANASEVTQFIKGIVEEAVLMEEEGTELTYHLPDDPAHTALFGKLFDALDLNLAKLGISSYGISDTTLEEVFLRVAEQMGVDEDLSEEDHRQRIELLTDAGTYARPITRLSFRRNRNNFLGMSKRSDRRNLLDSDSVNEPAVYSPLLRSTSAEPLVEDEEDEEANPGPYADPQMVAQCNGAGSYRVTGSKLIKRQFWALILKRFNYVKRSKKGFVSQVILPAAFICMAMIFAMVNPPIPNQPPMEIHPWHMQTKKLDDSRLNMFYSNDAPGTWSDKTEELLINKPGPGNRCMDPDYHSVGGYPCVEVAAEDAKWTKSSGDHNVSIQCDCTTTGTQMCPAGAGGSAPSVRLMESNDYLHNLTGRNISDYLVKTTNQYTLRRYGGLSMGEVNRLVTANTSVVNEMLDRLMVAANGGQEHDIPIDTPVNPFIMDLEKILPESATRDNAKIWFNNKGYVSMVSYMNQMANLILRAELPDNVKKEQYGITIINHPMNRTRAQLSTYMLFMNAWDVLIAISVIFAMSFIPASFVLFLIEERVSNSKHLQFVSGVNPTIYWLASFTWDMINYTIPCIICILIFVAFQKESFVSSDNAPCLICLLLLYGWAVTPMMYPACWVFGVPSSAFVGLSCLNVFLGIISTISTFILELLQEDDLDDINDILKQVFLLLPHYCLGRGLIDMSRNQLVSDALAAFGEDSFRNPFEWDLVGRNLFALAMEGILFWLITLSIQYKFWYNNWPCFKTRKKPSFGLGEPLEEDIDVARERRRVLGGNAQDDIITIERLTKVYKSIRRKKHCAVDNICLGVHKGECFGLLGVNGAGKTTTFRMLTGDLGVTDGDAHLKGHSVLSEIRSVHQHLGYCPQFDALCPLLTGVEHLQFYARLRGVPEQDIKAVTAWGIQKLGLTRHATKCARDYSGGNKRKLSTAIALVGNPPVMFLDEPTTGMDPKARRFLWNCITNIIKDGRSVILTSHSMEECEALCSRISIMVNGQFKCLGSIQHLKSRFGDGHMLIMRISGRDPNLTSLTSFVESTFRGAVLKEHHHNMVQYQLPGDHTLAQIFNHVESVRQQYHIEDYSVSQTTLDQVFINFAKQQTDLAEDELEAAKASLRLSSSKNSSTPPESFIVEGAQLPYYGTESLPDTQPRSLHGSTINLVTDDQLAPDNKNGNVSNV